jgi:hypothetical protein
MQAFRSPALLLTLLILGIPSLAKAQGYDPSQNEAQGYQALNDAGVAVDPPGRVARVSVLLGNVSVEPASVNQFSAAEANLPLTTGDRIYADQAANAELQTGQLALRLGQLTDLTVTAMTDALAQFGLAQGSVHLRSFGLYQGETVELDTPGVAVTVLQPGDVRVDVDPNAGTTLITLFSGAVDIEGNGLSQQLSPGQALLVTGTNPPYGQFVGRARADGLDRFSADRDNLYQSSLAQESQYVDPATIGAEDLASSGDWETDSDIGPVWYPSGVAVGWQPYVYGHWTWIAPWGWTWVENEPWGFAPFHYGRWFQRGNRWGWVPGPPTIRPIYSPALVVFVGGTGSGISAWFPLGPREVYTPWYHASTVYVNRVNVTNIYNRNTVEVRNTYNQRTVNVYANATAGQQNYANRSTATVAVSQANFAAGRPVAQSMVRVDPRQLAAAPVLPHPVVSPERSMVVGPPARAVPPVQARPVLTTHNGYVPTVGGPSNIRSAGTFQQPAGSVTMPRPGQQIVRAPVVTPNETQQPAGGVAMPRPVQGVVRAPFDRPAESQPVAPGRPAFTPQGPRATDPQPMPPRPTETPRPGPQPAAPQQPAPQQLYNRAVPPEPRPSFDQQRQAIESTDPGRPLSPQQLNNVRQSAPAGPAQRPEAPHPAPASAPMRSTPAPAPAPASRPALGDHHR